MCPLSDGLPPEARRQYILAKLKPGCVLRLEIKFPEKSKPKFLVLAAEDDSDYLTFFINTEIHPFIRSKPQLLQCQVKIDAAEHLFLQYTSHLACHEVKMLRREEVVHALMQDTSRLKGQISDAARNEILAAVKFAQTLSTNHKQLIISALN